MEKDENIEVRSPCVRNCCLDDQDICVGCFRSLDEIMQWSQAAPEEKRKIIDSADHRRAKARR